MRLPFTALEHWYANGGDRPPLRHLADRIGVSYQTVARWRNDGIPHDDADTAAIALGAHPTEIWPLYDEIDPWWHTPLWLRRARTRAVLESWRLRVDCTGTAGDHARHMFNIDEGDTAA